MKPNSRCLTACGLSVGALLCWLVMFLAGTDVWHDIGSPDVWTLQGPPYPDVRGFLYAFYLLFAMLVASTAVAVLDVVRGKRAGPKRLTRRATSCRG
jgi:hypothetical protein